MHVEFHGAARTVTGSCTLLEAGGTRILVDCGQFQGDAVLEKRNQERFAFDPATIDAVVLTHAHIDHIGRAPALIRRGFKGRFVCTRATSELAVVMLNDSAKIAAEDAERGGPPPTFGVAEVQALYEHVESIPYGKAMTLGKGIEVTLIDAGHILGSAHALVTMREEGKTVRFGVSGDVGGSDRPVVADPTPFDGVDYLQIESTYGDRDHKSPEESVAELERILMEADGGVGNVLVPAFALGRTQEILYHVNAWKNAGKLPRLKVFVDSPLASRVTVVFENNPAAYDDDAKGLLKRGDDPFDFPGLHFVRDARESGNLTKEAKGSLIIAASGMCQSGRILGHLAAMLPREETQVVIVGYQAPGTIGDRLVHRETSVRIRGQEIPVRAKIHTLGGFSAHAGKHELLSWVGAIHEKPRLVFVVHGELHAQMELAKALTAEQGLDVRIPRHGESFTLT